MNTSFSNRFTTRFFSLVLLGVLTAYGCQRDINQVASLPVPNLTAPSGLRIANSLSELEAKVATVFHQDAQNIRVTRVNFLDSDVGFGCVIEYLNQLTKTSGKMALYRNGAGGSDKSARVGSDEVSGYCTCGTVSNVASADCDPTVSKTLDTYSVTCNNNSKCQLGCVGHLVTP